MLNSIMISIPVKYLYIFFNLARQIKQVKENKIFFYNLFTPFAPAKANRIINGILGIICLNRQESYFLQVNPLFRVSVPSKNTFKRIGIPEWLEKIWP